MFSAGAGILIGHRAGAGGHGHGRARAQLLVGAIVTFFKEGSGILVGHRAGAGGHGHGRARANIFMPDANTNSHIVLLSLQYSLTDHFFVFHFCSPS